MAPNSQTALLVVAKAADEHGAGPLLRVVLVVMLVGCVLVAWLLLRGYRQEPEAQQGPAPGGTAPPGTKPAAPGGADPVDTPGPEAADPGEEAAASTEAGHATAGGAGPRREH